MEGLDPTSLDGFGPDLESPVLIQPLAMPCQTGDGLAEALAVAHVAHGMDPLDAALQAQLDAPLMKPFLP